MKKRIQPAIIGIIQKDNKYLLTRRQDLDREDSELNGRWQYPGGGMEFAETPESALIREIKEECGIDISIKKLLPKIFTTVRENWQGLFICYHCEMADMNAGIIINEEASEYGWFTYEEIINMKTFPLTCEILRFLINS